MQKQGTDPTELHCLTILAALSSEGFDYLATVQSHYHVISQLFRSSFFDLISVLHA